MSRQIQIRRGTAAENEAFTGAIGEVTMDTTNKTLRVHDGTTVGGTILAKQSEIPEPYTMPENYDFVIESQAPTSSNNYTWYRKHKSGWIEQGGIKTVNYTAQNTDVSFSCNFATQFSNSNYTVTANCIGGWATSRQFGIENKSVSSISGFVKQSTSTTLKIIWFACGF